MHITIMTAGSRGDVQPYIALGKGLQEAGHQVRLLSSDDFAPLASAAGLEFASSGVHTEQMLQSAEWQGVAEGGNLLSILVQMRRELKRVAQQQATILPQACQRTDLIVTGINGLLGGCSIAEHLQIPLVQTYLLPLTPTREFASILMPFSLRGPLNRLSHHLTRQLIWQTFRIADVTVRRELDMPPGSIWGPFKALQQRRVPILHGYSTHVLPRPADWPDFVHITGFWTLDASPDWSPPADLLDFLQAGPPPVYIGFGSMSNRNPEETAALALEALSRSGQRGVLSSGWGGLAASDLPESVFMVGSIPHRWLFPRMAAVVHHGGVGTTAAGLQAGVPSIVIPFMGDQPYWGRRVAALGVGPAPIPRKRLTAERLADAVARAVSDPVMCERAAALGEKLRAEDGIARAVALIEAAVTQPA